MSPNISPNLCIEGILRLHKLGRKILHFLCEKKMTSISSSEEHYKAAPCKHFKLKLFLSYFFISDLNESVDK